MRRKRGPADAGNRPLGLDPSITKGDIMLLHKVTVFGFGINAAIDAGHHVSIADVKAQVNAGTIFDPGMIFDVVAKLVGSNVGTAFLDAEDRAELLRRWQSYNNAIDPLRKMGIKSNGLCLLIAYCFENLQSPDDGWGDPRGWSGEEWDGVERRTEPWR